MKNNRGVSAISLMVTIVVIILIASYSVFFSRDAVVEGNVAKIYSEIQEVTEAVKALSLDYSIALETLSGFELVSVEGMNQRVGNNLESDKQYYYLGFGDDSLTEVMKQTLNDKLGVRSIENNYVVSVGDIGDVDVFLVDGINITGDNCYSFEEIHQKYSEIAVK